MPYPKNLLNEGEDIVLGRHPHWSFMLSAVFMFVLTIIVFIVITAVQTSWWWVGAIIVFFGGLGLLGRYMRWKTIDFVVTTDRIIVRQGILAKSGIEIPLDRIMNISYHQALWERILGTGDLIIESAGESGHQPFTDVAHPSYVQNVIYRQSEIYQGRSRGGNSGDGPDDAGMGDETRGHGGMGDSGQHHHEMSVPEQIEKLADLHARGILSDAEFEDKKRALLDRM